MARYTLIDAFSGAGGLTKGFVETNQFDPVAAFENNDDARQTYALNYHHGDLARVFSDAATPDFKLLPFEPDVLIGGPPCQDFTQLATVRQNYTRARNDLLWHAYLNLVLNLRPKVFLIENVPNLLTDDGYATYRAELVEELTKAGYRMTSGILNAAQYGVPQARQRAFVLGTRLDGVEPRLPLPSVHVGSVWDKIANLAVDPPSESVSGKRERVGAALHVGRRPEVLSRLRYRYVLPGGNRLHLPTPITIRTWANRPGGTADGFGRLHPFRPSPTIRCEAYKPEKGRYLHPFANRPLTLLEMARLQTFPDDFRFYGSYTSVARQIGNAVPPRLAQALAEAVLRILDNNSSTVLNWTEDVVTLERLGADAPRTLRALFTKFVGRPIAWCAIEVTVRKEKRALAVDWGSALLQLREAGYHIEDWTAGEIPYGTYRLAQEKPDPVHIRPAAMRLREAQLLIRGCCDKCGGGTNLTATFVRQPRTVKDLTPGIVAVLCETCSHMTEPLQVSSAEEQIYSFLRLYKHYKPVAAVMLEAIGESPTLFHEGPLPPIANSWAELQREVLSHTKACTLCGTSGPLSVEIVRPLNDGGLLVQSNTWALCDSCQAELDLQTIKVPSETEVGAMVPLRSRFKQPGFLTLQEAHVRNWVLLNRQNAVIFDEIRRILLGSD